MKYAIQKETQSQESLLQSHSQQQNISKKNMARHHFPQMFPQSSKKSLRKSSNSRDVKVSKFRKQHLLLKKKFHQAETPVLITFFCGKK